MLLEDEYPNTIISLRNVPLQFKYIGSFISQNEPNTKGIEINHPIQIAYTQFSTMNKLLQNSKIQLKA